MDTGHTAVPHGDGNVNLFWRRWGSADASRTAVCIHGISRNGSDFRWLGEDLAEHGWCVYAFDMVGRGGSDWLDDPSGYTIPAYAGHMAHALQALNLQYVDWIGTSMGGLLGMVMDSAANIIVVGPVLVDVMVKAGYPDVQAALVVVVGFLIGSVTPPVGVAFFTAGAIANVRLEKVAVAMLPYLAALFALLSLLIIAHGFTMYLPRAFGFVN